MSTQFRTPLKFVRRDEIRFCPGRAVERAELKGKSACDSSLLRKAPAALRDSHIVLYAVDALVTLHASFKKWRNHRLTLRALADLNEHQLRDIGLARDENGYRPLEDLDTPVKEKTTLARKCGAIFHA